MSWGVCLPDEPKATLPWFSDVPGHSRPLWEGEKWRGHERPWTSESQATATPVILKMKWLFSKVFAQLLPCILLRYRLIWLDKVTWFKSWFHNLHKWESTLTFLLSQTLRQFEIYEQIFQVSLVVEECLEKGKKQKRLFITWCSTPSTTFRHISRLFLRLGQLRSYKTTRLRTEAPLEIGDWV